MFCSCDYGLDMPGPQGAKLRRMKMPVLYAHDEHAEDRAPAKAVVCRAAER